MKCRNVLKHKGLIIGTPSKETLTSGATETVTTEPSTQEELTSYHTTFTKLEDATDGTNLETTAQQHVEGNV